MTRIGFATRLSISAIALVGLLRCGSQTGSAPTIIEETGQQVGEVTASIDESASGSSGSFALIEGARRTFARWSPGDQPVISLLGAEAQAAACGTSATLSACSNNVRTRTFDNCTVGGVTFSGTVTLTWGDAGVDNTCAMTTTGHTITRVPAFTVTGRFGGVFTVAKTGSIGQRITRQAAADTFNFTNDGIRRSFTAGGASSPSLDFTTSTESAITITGASRSARVLNGGSLKITNNITGNTASLVPANVTWSATCNCPVSGSWSGSSLGGSSITVTHTGCGTATVVVGTTTADITLDRCYAI